MNLQLQISLLLLEDQIKHYQALLTFLRSPFGRCRRKRTTGCFFYWSALKMVKCQTLRKFWHLEPLGADQSKKNTLYIRFGVKPQENHLFLAAMRRTQQRKETKPRKLSGHLLRRRYIQSSKYPIFSEREWQRESFETLRVEIWKWRGGKWT